MKKRIKEARKKKGSSDGLDFYLFWGYKGVQTSFAILLMIILIIIAFFIISSSNLSELSKIIFKSPQGQDYLVIIAGVILFIAVPFYIGIRIGLSMKKK